MSRSSKERSLERETRFPGYGDRVGSGVEFAPAYWTGGELVTDPSLVTKSLKPRRMYYSPIGDGVVAADGIEMKRGPQDLTPRVSVTHQRIVEKSDPGRDGVRITEKQWTTGSTDGGSILNSRAGSEFGSGFPDSGRESRATIAPSPFGSFADPLALGNTNLGNPPGTSASNKSTGRDPYGTLNSNKYDTLNGLGDRYLSQANIPTSGRTSATSALFSDPGMRYEMKKDYLVTNPKELIHQFATTTPVHTIPGYETLPDSGTVTRTLKQSYSKSTTEESYSPYPPYHSAAGNAIINPLKFVRQIRDEGLTSRQQQANQNLQPITQSDVFTDRKVQEIQHQTNRSRHVPDVDSLTDRLILGLQTGHPTPPRL